MSNPINDFPNAMNGKSRFLAALSGSILDFVPRWDIEFHLFDNLSSQRLLLGHDFCALAENEQQKALRQNAEIMISVAEKYQFDALTVPNAYWEVSPGVAAYYWLPPEARRQFTDILRELSSGKIALAAVIGGLISAPADASYIDFCYQLFDAPDLIEEKAEKNLQQGIEQISIMRDWGIDVLINACDIADNHGVFFSPAQLQRFWSPFLYRWVAEVRQAGLLSILHSDGNLQAILELLADSGLNGLQAIDPTAGMDIALVKAQVGNRITLCGNIDCGLLIMGSAEEVSAKTKETVLAAKTEGRFILGASNALQAEVPLENFHSMQQAWLETRNY